MSGTRPLASQEQAPISWKGTAPERRSRAARARRESRRLAGAQHNRHGSAQDAPGTRAGRALHGTALQGCVPRFADRFATRLMGVGPC